MGVRDLFAFLRHRGIPYERHRPSYFARSTIAVDGYSLFFRLYYAAKKMGFKNHKETALSLLEVFLRKWPPTTTLIFVLDSPVKSEMKRATILKRRADEQALQKEMQDLEKIDGVLNPVLRARQEMLRQRSKETFPQVCRDMIDYLRGHDYRVIVSDGEAERTACEMVIAGEAQYVYSNDSDCLALSCPAVIFEDMGGYLHVFRLSSILEPLGLEVPEFTDFCILLGTDFNDRILGPEEAFENITKFRRIANIPSISPETVRELERVRLQYHSDESGETESEVAPLPPVPSPKAKRKIVIRRGKARG